MDGIGDLGVFVAGVGAGGLGVGLAVALTKVRELERRIAALEAKRKKDSNPGVALPPDVWSVVSLLRLSSKDTLDALTRLSPDAALAVVKELMPQLFERRVG